MTAKNGFQIRIVQQKIHNIKEKKALFLYDLKGKQYQISSAQSMNAEKNSQDFSQIIMEFSMNYAVKCDFTPWQM